MAGCADKAQTKVDSGTTTVISETEQSDASLTIARPVVSMLVRAHDGQPLSAWGARVTRAGCETPLVTKEFTGDGAGRWKLELPEPGLYQVQLHGVDHASYTALVWVRGDAQIDGRLGTYERGEAGETVALQLQWLTGEGEEPSAAESHTARRVSEGEGRYRVEVKAPEGVTALRARAEGWVVDRTVNLPGSPRFVSDGGGDYWSEYPWSASKTELIVDFGRAVPPGSPAKITVGGDGDAVDVGRARAAKIVKEAEESVESLLEAAAPVEDEEEARDTALAKVLGELGDKVLATPAGLAREHLALKIASFEQSQLIEAGRRSGRRFELVRTYVPADSVAWATLGEMGEASWIVLGMLRGPGWETYTNALAQHPETSVRAQVIQAEHSKAISDRNYERAGALYEQMKAEFSDVKSLWFTLKKYDPALPIQRGKPMISWSFPRMGKKESLNSEALKGTPYVFDVWGTWCAGCVQDMPTLHSTYASINGVAPPRPAKRPGRAPTMGAAENPRVQFVSLGVGDAPGTVKKFRKTQWPMPWEHLVLPEEMDLDGLSKAWGFDWYPFVVLVDKDGVVVAVDDGLRGTQLRETLREHLGEAPREAEEEAAEPLEAAG